MRPGAILRLRVPPDARYGKYVRERLMSFANTYELPEADLREFMIAVGEALANAIEHAQSREAIEVATWFLDGDKLVATVVDTGIGFAPPDVPAGPALPPTDSERGRGLPIMQSCTDVFTVRSRPGKGTAVVLGRYLRGGRRAEQRV